MFNKKTLCKMALIGALIGAAGFVTSINNISLVYAEDDGLQNFYEEEKAIQQINKEARKFTIFGNYEKAIDILSEGINKYHDSKSHFLMLLYFNRSLSYRSLKEYDNALADINKAIELDPYNLEYYESKADIYDNMDQHDKVIEIYNQLIEKNAYELEYYRKRGEVYEKLNDEQHATEDYKKYLSMWSKPDEIMDFNDYWFRGEIYQKLKDYQHAIEDYTKAMKFNKSRNMKHLYKMRGECYEALGEKEKAKADFVEAKMLGN